LLGYVAFVVNTILILVTYNKTVLWLFPSVCSVFCDYTLGVRKILNVINKYN